MNCSSPRGHGSRRRGEGDKKALMNPKVVINGPETTNKRPFSGEWLGET